MGPSSVGLRKGSNLCPLPLEQSPVPESILNLVWVFLGNAKKPRILAEKKKKKVASVNH